MKLLKNTKLPWELFPILLAGSLVRFIFLDKIPNAVGGDELIYILTAKSIFVSGSDLTQIWNPLSILWFNYPPGQNQAEILYLLQIPFVGFAKLSLLSSRILNLILGTALIYVIYLLARQIFDKKVGVIAAFITAFNPWLIFIGRTSYEGVAVILFYSLGLYILLAAKNKNILFSIPIFFLAFYSYIADKLVFIPFVALSILFAYFSARKRYKKEYITVLISCIILFSFFVFMSQSSSNPRTSEVFTPLSAQLPKLVDDQRHLFINTPLTNIFENRVTEYARVIITKLFKIFSFDYLFVFGDRFFSITRHGLFYVLDLFFVVFGILGLYVKNRRKLLFLALFIFIGVIPHIFHTARDDNFTPHLNLFFPFMFILIAYGVKEFLSYFVGKNLKFISTSVSLVYILLVFNFLNIYFFQNPLMGNFDFKMRLLSKYLSLYDNKEVDIYSNLRKDIFLKHIFYTDSIKKQNAEVISQNLKADRFSLKNSKIHNCNPSLDPALHEEKIIVFDPNCEYIGTERQKLKVARLADGGADYIIFNDTICSKYDLKQYPRISSVSQFSIEDMPAKDFCETFITR